MVERKFKAFAVRKLAVGEGLLNSQVLQTCPSRSPTTLDVPFSRAAQSEVIVCSHFM
jgi:hypothetical protein